MEGILPSVPPGSFHRGVFSVIEIIRFRYSRQVWISHILFHCQACVLVWDLGKKVHWAWKVSKHQGHLWVLTGLGHGRFGESAAFARGHFEKKFLIWFYTSYSWTGLLFQLSMGFTDTVHFMEGFRQYFVLKCPGRASVKCILDVYNSAE